MLHEFSYTSLMSDQFNMLRSSGFIDRGPIIPNSMRILHLIQLASSDANTTSTNDKSIGFTKVLCLCAYKVCATFTTGTSACKTPFLLAIWARNHVAATVPDHHHTTRWAWLVRLYTAELRKDLLS